MAVFDKYNSRLTTLLSGMKIFKTGDKLPWLINSANDQQLLKNNNSLSDARFQIMTDLWQKDGKPIANGKKTLIEPCPVLPMVKSLLMTSDNGLILSTA